MSSKEVKTALKSARDAIKNKEYKDVLKHCKVVLKLEKNNYNAWVFIGVAASELEQPDQAQAAYRKAAELEPDQLLAWQGLANFYEKNDQADLQTELLKVYHRLVDLYESSDKLKFQEVSRKLVDLYHSQHDYLQVTRVWLRLLELKEVEEGVDKAELRTLWQQMTLFLQDTVEELDVETQNHLITAYERVLTLTENVPCEEHKKISEDYIQCLSKIPREEDKLQKACKAMGSLYPLQTFPLEILSSYYLTAGVYSEEAVSCFSCLLDLDRNSGPALLGLGGKALQDRKYEEAIKNLTQGLKQVPSCTVGWLSLAQAQQKMHRYPDCAASCSKGLAVCVGEEVKVNLLRLKLEALVRSGVHSREEAVKTLNQISDGQCDPVLLFLKGKLFLQKGQNEDALQVSAELLHSHPNAAEGSVLKGLVHMAEDDQQQAEHSFLKAVSQCPESAECNFLLSQLYWTKEETHQDKSKVHTHLLKAAKLDPYFGPVFRYLGHYYREVAKDPTRARGCYKRAFELNSSDVEAGAATVDISMEQGDMDSALAVLQSVTEKATPGSAKWAWIRRGLYHLKTNQNNQAIADLQAALRADPTDWVCWECLGEAYLNRHSFTAALKAFSKAHQLQPDSIYSLYQMAAIKQTLCHYKEAAGEYIQITLKEDYVPALKGLGECFIALARSAMADCLDGKAVDLTQKAIEYLFRAVQHRPDLSCLWKLLGDACSSCTVVAPVRAQILVPVALSGDDAQNQDQDHILDQRQLLTLGERCYGRALKLMPEAPNLWHDLGINYYHQAQKLMSSSQETEAQPVLQKSLQCIKKAVMLDSANHSYWNALGVVSMAKGIENYALAQHSFIKSVMSERNNVVAWTNLGVLYLKRENIELSHEAFKTAQSLEPLYVRCWIGQALIAEMVDSYDTMDLFRHTTELSTHTEGVKGYAYWVCSTLLDKSNRDSELYRYNIVQMNAVSAAQEALCKYTERVQTDADAFIMLGYLNEQLHLKKQAAASYQRAVELLQVASHTSMLNFTLRNYGRTLCDIGQPEEAVRVYSLVPLEELQDLVGLALAAFRAGHLQDSVTAYEKALAVAPSEKERAYILTALALLQHQMGSVDTAKTLLFKCSLLKEPISESLVCLCALGLVYGDGTLAAAALTELQKLKAATGATMEHRCLLTCTLLALQGNYSSVQREAARGVHSNPGNPSLWALLSRLVAEFCPRKANGGAVAGSVACQSSMTLGKALLYSGVNQLASGRHFGECSYRNPLKTIQRAVLLCPDDVATWAGLMAACHTENTACSLRGSTPRRQGLERILMTLVSEKAQAADAQDRPLTQAVEGWALQQALTGLRQAGQYEQAEALCSQVLSVSPDHPAVFLQLSQVQCERLLLEATSEQIPIPFLEQLNTTVMGKNTSVSSLHWLAEVCRSQGLLVQATVAYKQSLQLASHLGHCSGQMGSLLRLALLALAPCMSNVPGNSWKDLVQEATTEALKLDPTQTVALLIQALLQFSIKTGARETRRLLERLVYSMPAEQTETVASVARWYLLRHLHAKNDIELIDALMDQAKTVKDSRMMDFYRKLFPSA
ncbi:tetratricopeptide repeat protein 37 isoform X2 [Denticeps clupeoides]|uniref:tetratricopeptide repeat protein 37 isoform X2 n=1 Tax=Denticeps clupeoides TaxID=299321 RepID=UPI0010A4BF83|nr:tetratricopeptide repeat protein 37 isoform X2 [Denticeps clupeoides]